MIWFLIFVASYIIGVIGWGIIFIIIDDAVETVNDLKEGLLDSPAIIPFLNIILLMCFIPFKIGILICILMLLLINTLFAVNYNMIIIEDLLKKGYVPLDYNSSNILIKKGIYFKLQ